MTVPQSSTASFVQEQKREATEASNEFISTLPSDPRNNEHHEYGSSSSSSSSSSVFTEISEKIKHYIPSLARLMTLILPNSLLTKEVLDHTNAFDRYLGKIITSNLQRRPATTFFSILLAIFSLVPIALFMFYLVCATFFTLAGFMIVEAAVVLFGLGFLLMTVIAIASFCFGTTVFFITAAWALKIIAGIFDIDLASSFTNFHVVRSRPSASHHGSSQNDNNNNTSADSHSQQSATSTGQ